MRVRALDGGRPGHLLLKTVTTSPTMCAHLAWAPDALRAERSTQVFTETLFRMEEPALPVFPRDGQRLSEDPRDQDAPGG